MEVYIVDALKGLFQASETESVSSTKRARWVKRLDATWKMDQNVATFTTGIFGAANTPNIVDGPGERKSDQAFPCRVSRLQRAEP